MIKRIGISMRVVDNKGYPEKRDALSKDWHEYIAKILPKFILIPLLNQPESIERFVRELGVSGIILSGGNDWGTAKKRDDTEKRLISYCIKHNIPLLGVCRGMQVLNLFFKGKLNKHIETATRQKHINVVHNVALSDDAANLFKRKQIRVNSYHGQGVLINDLSPVLRVFACTSEGVIEGVYHRRRPIIGIQWHPERKTPSGQFDAKLIRRLFLHNRGIK